MTDAKLPRRPASLPAPAQASGSELTSGPTPPVSSAFSGRLEPGKRMALIIIDVVQAYLDPASPLYLAGTGKTALAAVLKLTSAARSTKIPVVLTRVIYDSRGIEGGVFFRKIPALTSFVEGNPLGAFPEHLPSDNDIIVTKNYASAFFATSLASTLRALGVDTVLLAGFSTSGCVRASAVDAIQHGFVPFVIEDACADRTEERHRGNLDDIEAKYGEVISTAEALRYIAAAPAPRG